MEGQLASALGPVCENKELRSALLEGGAGVHGLDKDLDQMLSILSGHAQQNGLECSISRGDYAQFWKGAREGTSSSPRK